ncbi:MFS transporter (plasmid) [Deinococcus psychrotolerans]|uniref:MFS transporter n=1 Tax=Deinococcus psychrotolerans TaxID=2489213 RepID=A0A3G8YSN6_9DEIO|nr:MFS transporter [Deinococcus psychrotolerans]AZI44741.1 MFS transporter [Deinococcus psychrotolerans]
MSHLAADPPPNGFRTFSILWASQSVSVLGSALSAFAFNIYLAQTVFPLESQKPQLALALSVTALAFTFTAMLGAPLAGVWADRRDRRATMLGCDLISAALALSIGLLLLLWQPSFWSLLPLVALTGLVGSFHISAFDTSYATLVSSAQLPRANGMMQTIQSLSGLASPAIAALIVALPALARKSGQDTWLSGLESGVPLAFLLDAVSFSVAALVLTRLRIPSPAAHAPTETAEKRSILSDIGFGWRYILDRRPLLWLLLTFALVNFVSGPLGIFETLLTKYQLAPDWQARGYSFAPALALLTTLGSVGGVLGGVVISAWGGLKRQRVLGVLVPMILLGAAQLLFGASRSLYLSGAALLLFGLTVPFLNAHSQSIWQGQVPPALQGRVFSVRRLIAQFTGPLSIALASFAAAAFPVGWVVMALAAVLIVFCVGQLFNPALRRVEDQAGLDQEAARRSIRRAVLKQRPRT